MLKKFPYGEMFGAPVQKISDSIYHLCRGNIYNIENNKIFVMGGAESHNKYCRVEWVNWWKDELPLRSEYENALNNLNKHRNRVDYILSHCASYDMQGSMGFGKNTEYTNSALSKFFDRLEAEVKFKKWYFGHYYLDEALDLKHTCMYRDIIKLGE